MTPKNKTSNENDKMALDSNSCNNSNLVKESEKFVKDHNENGSYLVVDHGEQILLDIEESKLELQKQIVTLLEKVCLLWDIVRRSIIFILPVLAGMFVCLLSSQFLPKHLAFWVSMLMFTITFGLIFINLEPLNDAISTFLNHQMYVPHLKTEVCQEQTTDVDCELNSSKTETIKPSSELDLLELD